MLTLNIPLITWSVIAGAMVVLLAVRVASTLRTHRRKNEHHTTIIG